MATIRGLIFTLVAFVNCPIQVIFDIINIHDFNQFGASSFAASVQLTKKRENYLCLRHLCYTLLIFVTSTSAWNMWSILKLLHSCQLCDSFVTVLIFSLAVHNSSIGDLVCPLVGLTPLTIRVFTTLQRIVTLENCDLRDIWSEWWGGDMTWLKKTYLHTHVPHTYPPTYLPNFFITFSQLFFQLSPTFPQLFLNLFSTCSQPFLNFFSAFFPTFFYTLKERS